MKPAVYVGEFLFPEGDAGAHRVLAMGKILREAGFSVTFLGAEPEGRPQDARPGGDFFYAGLRYIPDGSPGRSMPQRLWRLWHSRLAGFSIFARLRKCRIHGSGVVLAYQASTPVLARLRRFCSEKGLVLVCDAVEWYDPGHLPGGRLGPLSLDSELRMRWMQAKADGVIGISSYLTNYYGRRGTPALRVPALVDLTEPHWQVSAPPVADSSRPLQIAFVGHAGKKDLLSNALRGMALAGERAKDVTLTIVGPTKAKVAESLGRDAPLLEALCSRLRFTGLLPHRAALEHLGSADFSIILRPDLRFALAGFPTKLVESLAMGVAPICNLTGDIGMYVRDGIEGIVVTDCSPASFAEGLTRSVAIPAAQRAAMRQNARRCAEQNFDFPKWVGPVDAFLSDLIERRKAGEHSRRTLRD